MRFRSLLAAGVAVAALLAADLTQAQTLRIAMTTSDIPTTGGIPDNGSEGYRFVGYTAYDGLVNWDFEHPDQIADVVPGLATEWHIDPDNNKKWIFTLRQGVKFQDGTDFTADSAIWNLDRIFNDKSPQHDGALTAIVRSAINVLDRYEKVDESHIAIYTKIPYSPFYYLMTRVLFASPAQFEKVGKSWTAFMEKPIGTGPFKITKVTPHVSVELERNENYWDKSRIPKLQKLVLLPMPEPTTRLAALRSGQVDWIEVPPPDAIPSLKSAGFQIVLKSYPHIWPWYLSEADNSPFKDKRVRLALNYAIDREGLVKLLNGTAEPADGFYDGGHPSFGNPEEHFKYEPEKAKALLKEVGFGPNKPVKIKVMISTAGSGQMLPVPMNELIQANLKDVGFDVDYDVVDWGTMLVANRSPAMSPASHGVQAINSSLPSADPTFMYRFFSSSSIPPNGSNWTGYSNPKVDALLNSAFSNFDPPQRDKILGEAHAIIVDDAVWGFIVHDLNPRALSPKVKGFIPVQSWYQDFTKVTVQR